MGENAIHAMAELMHRLAEYAPRSRHRRLTYREALQADAIGGGVAGNVVPDAAC